MPTLRASDWSAGWLVRVGGVGAARARPPRPLRCAPRRAHGGGHGRPRALRPHAAGETYGYANVSIYIYIHTRGRWAPLIIYLFIITLMLCGVLGAHGGGHGRPRALRITKYYDEQYY
eukprot:1189218-Prorocentrum_minimum.AAC.6